MKRFMLICVISMLSFTLVLFAHSAEPDGVAFDFGEMYVVDGNPKELPHTFEATVYIPEDADTSTRLGTIMSTYTALDTYYFHFDIYSGDSTLFPRFEWKGLYDKSTNNLARSFNFKKAVLEPGNWYHIAIVIDSANAFLHCYIDGEYVQSNSGGIRLADIDARVIDYPIIVGNDNRPYQKFNFKGKIDCIAMFSDVRTPAQINADYVSVGDIDWLFVGLDWGTERREVEWAKEVVEAHPNHKVAIFTHSYLHGDGTTIDEEDTGSYGDGLFGVICGATVENVVLENIVLWSNGVTGAVVGRAVPSADKKSVISGCTVKSDCSIYSNNSNANRSHLPSAYDDVSNDGVIGVICGMAHGTVIENCVSHADILGILNMLCKG